MYLHSETWPELKLFESAPGHIAPGHIAPGHIAPGHIAPGHIAPGHIAPGPGLYRYWSNKMSPARGLYLAVARAVKIIAQHREPRRDFSVAP